MATDAPQLKRSKVNASSAVEPTTFQLDDQLIELLEIFPEDNVWFDQLSKIIDEWDHIKKAALLKESKKTQIRRIQHDSQTKGRS
jgi:hypothetical protein